MKMGANEVENVRGSLAKAQRRQGRRERKIAALFKLRSKLLFCDHSAPLSLRLCALARFIQWAVIQAKCFRPTAVLFDLAVNRSHHGDRFANRGDKIDVVRDFVVAEFAAPAVAKPFAADLVGADLEAPRMAVDIG